MPGSDALLVIAQIAVGIAGFGGIAVALGRNRATEWDPAMRWRLTNFLVISLGCIFFCLLPLVLLLVPLPTARVVAIAGFLAGLFIASQTFLTIWKTSHLPTRSRSTYRRAVTIPLWTTNLVLSVGIMLNAFGVFFDRAPWVYLGFMLWVLFWACFQFMRIVLLAMTTR